ncbi:MAG: tRNA (guanosine(46)-N7)-methyltransferase TrmB [Opitutae bacterium]|nr:tRNA (guanosine(46)-N7)-methyltransferase TrmB [Opitutae bacterium]
MATRLFLHSTDPELTARMDPKVRRLIEQRQRTLKKALQSRLKRARTITLEIGCGHGHFLTAYAERFPEEFCIGIDVNRRRIDRAVIKAERSRAKNLWFLYAEAMEFLKFLPRTVKLGKIWILYPDPWPKKRHFKNRIIQAEFLGALADACRRSAKLHIKSDQAEFMEWTRDLLLASDEWRLSRRQAFPELATTVFQTLTRGKAFEVTARLEPMEKADNQKLPTHCDD